jgi:large subunit ribosomal protein L9
MKLILRADVDNLGRLGEVVTVKPGFGRNYLVPQGLAMPATEGNLRAFELERKKLQARMDAVKAAAQDLSDKLTAERVIVRVRVGEGGRLYGSVSTSNIAEALAERGVEFDRRKIVLGEPIRALGEYSLEVKLHPDIETVLVVAVVSHDWVPGQPITPEEAEAAAAAKAEEEAASDDAGQPEEQPAV